MILPGAHFDKNYSFSVELGAAYGGAEIGTYETEVVLTPLQRRRRSEDSMSSSDDPSSSSSSSSSSSDSDDDDSVFRRNQKLRKRSRKIKTIITTKTKTIRKSTKSHKK